MKEAELSESITSLVVPQPLPWLSAPTFEHTLFDKVHAASEFSLNYDLLGWLGLDGNHVFYQQTFVHFVELPEEEGVHEVEAQHYLSALLFDPCFAEADRLSWQIAESIGLGTNSHPLAMSLPLPLGFLDAGELSSTDFFIFLRILIRLLVAMMCLLIGRLSEVSHGEF